VKIHGWKTFSAMHAKTQSAETLALVLVCNNNNLYILTKSLAIVAIADMYEPNHVAASLCRFDLEQLMSSHFAGAAGSDAGLRTAVSAAEMGLHRDDMASPASAGVPSLRLNHSEMWQRFAAVGTEMVITKSGRQAYA